jgi:hypothetical protein
MKMKPRIALSAVFAILAGWVAFKHVPAPLPELSRAEFLAEVGAGRVRRIVVEDRQVIVGEDSARGRFRTPYNERKDANFLNDLRAQGVEVLFDDSTALTP